MRVVWKEDKYQKEQRRYRSRILYRQLRGWTIDIPDDNNIYAAVSDAYNAIDKALGPRTGTRKKSELRGDKIRIIGQINEA